MEKILKKRGAKKRNYLSYKEAQEMIMKLGIKNIRQWRDHWKDNTKPKNLPSDPARIYSETNEWNGWFDFLGRNPRKKRSPNKSKTMTTEE